MISKSWRRWALSRFLLALAGLTRRHSGSRGADAGLGHPGVRIMNVKPGGEVAAVARIA